MKYKLIGNNDYSHIITNVLYNRGIENPQEYIGLNDNCYDNWNDLDNIDRAVECFVEHFNKKDKISVLSDCDVDGVCSATIMYQYIKMMNEDYPASVIIHTKNKAHGLSSWDFTIPENTKLLIIPDAASNDVNECQKLIDDGISVIILDHHQVSNEKPNPAIVVNNQTSTNYENKEACGTHVTYNFLQALDDEFWNSYCDEYFTDLVSLADLSDVMSIKSFGTRAMVNYGFEHIQNKMLKAIIEEQGFSMKGIVSPFTVTFYVTPLINSFLRTATLEERQLLIRGFCEDESETFEYTKRGESFSITEDIYKHLARLMTSYKGKQNRARDKALKILMNKAAACKNDKVIIVDATDDLDSSYTGLVAIKMAETLNSPVLLTQSMDEDTYGGSGRCYDYAPIEDFRGLVDECPYTTFAQGHEAAFGLQIPKDNIEQTKQWLNEQLKDISFEKVYTVDFELDASALNVSMFHELYSNKTLWGHGVDEPLFCIHNINVTSENAHIIGKNNDTVRIDEDGIEYIMFKCDDSNELYNEINENWSDLNINIDVVCKLTLNEYQSVYTPQVQIIACDVCK